MSWVNRTSAIKAQWYARHIAYYRVNAFRRILHNLRCDCGVKA